MGDRAAVASGPSAGTVASAARRLVRHGGRGVTAVTAVVTAGRAAGIVAGPVTGVPATSAIG